MPAPLLIIIAALFFGPLLILKLTARLIPMKSLPRSARMAINLLVLLASFYIVLLGLMIVFQRSLLYFPDRTPLAAAAAWTLARSTTADGMGLTHLYRPATSKTAGLIILFHGNGGNASARLAKGDALAHSGMAVLLAEYRGYGGNPGSPGETGLYADAASVLDWAKGEGYAPGRIIVYGESLGTGVATRLAADHRFRAVILEAPYTSIGAAAQSHYPFIPALWLTYDRYDSAARIAMIGAPLLILQGEKDEVVPVAMGRRLLELAREPRRGVFLPDAAHNDVFYSGGARPVLDFIAALPPDAADVED